MSSSEGEPDEDPEVILHGAWVGGHSAHLVVVGAAVVVLWVCNGVYERGGTGRGGAGRRASAGAGAADAHTGKAEGDVFFFFFSQLLL